jgi:hypothetical protein
MTVVVLRPPHLGAVMRLVSEILPRRPAYGQRRRTSRICGASPIASRAQARSYASYAGVVVVMIGTLFVTKAQAACPNELLRAQEGYAQKLPDCRAYEQVSPVQKNSADAIGKPGLTQSLASGGAVTFFGLPFPGVAGASEQVRYLSTRSDAGWTTEGILPSANVGETPTVTGVTANLSLAFVAITAAGKVDTYIRDNGTGSEQLLAPGVAHFADATPDDSRVLFESKAERLAELFPGVAAPGEVTNLYEWNDGRLSVAGVLPSGEAPAGGAVAGPGGAALETGGGELPGGATSDFYTQNTISEGGSRVFFSEASPTGEGGKGIIYMREPEAHKTVQVSAGTEPAYWRTATPSGAFVFYTEGENLYRYDAQANLREALTSGGAGVLGTIGSSDDGAYVYFVAEGVLAGTSGATAGDGNLYEWHQGHGLTFITTLNKADDVSDWSDFVFGGPGAEQGLKSSRVTPGGEAVLFASVEGLTGYDNLPTSGKCEGESHGCRELYLYSNATGETVCVSCNPRNGIEPASNAYLSVLKSLLSAPTSGNAFLTRNLSANGHRVFFQTAEPLVSSDTNGTMDVYEWEADGEGSCASASPAFSVTTDGCLYLLSTGQSSSESYFGDASASGDDAFIFTREALVGQDVDDNADLYDARVEGGISAQNPTPPATPCFGESCRGMAALAPVFATPSSNALLSGSGNLGPPAPTPLQQTGRPLTRAQKRAIALKACMKKPIKARAACRRRVRQRYARKSRIVSRTRKRVLRGH